MRKMKIEGMDSLAKTDQLVMKQQVHTDLFDLLCMAFKNSQTKSGPLKTSWKGKRNY